MDDEQLLKIQLFGFLESAKMPDPDIYEAAKKRWDSIGKPIAGLGLLEDAVARMAAVSRKVRIALDQKALVVMCGDHGVIAEGVSQCGPDVTAIVARNLADRRASASIMAARAGVDVFPVDVGIRGPKMGRPDLKAGQLTDRRLAEGTGNIAREPAMTSAQCMEALLTGINIVGDLSQAGYQAVCIGEMGVGNTTPASALTSVLLNLPADEVTGKGAGLSDEGLRHKIEVVERAVARYWAAAEQIEDGPHFRAEVGVEVLAQLGGFEIAAMTGLCIGGAVFGVPVILDGVISLASALAARLICENCVGSLFASHKPLEPAGAKILNYLHLKPVIDAGLCLGEGTGAVLALSLYESAAAVYNEMKTFDEIGVEPYRFSGGIR